MHSCVPHFLRETMASIAKAGHVAAAADNQLMAEWQGVQLEIARQVQIPDDEEDDDTCRTSASRPSSSRFRYLPLNGLGPNDLFGGVDVSFAPDPSSTGTGSSTSSSKDMAVAVYVIVRREQQDSAPPPASASACTCSKKKQQRKSQHADIVSPNYELVYSDHIHYQLTMPYVSTYLAFREIEPLEKLVQKQLDEYPQYTPRTILVDGNGILHPRHAGIACFLGVRTGIPTIGIGKKLCCVEENWSTDEVERSVAMGLNEMHTTTNVSSSTYMSESDDDGTMRQGEVLVIDQEDVTFGTSRGNDTNACIIDSACNIPSMTESVAKLPPFCSGYAVKLQASNERVLGAVLVGHGGKNSRRGQSRGTRTPTVKPIYVSVGHAISLQGAVRLCAELSDFRIPEPVRVADLLGRKLMRDQGNTH